MSIHNKRQEDREMADRAEWERLTGDPELKTELHKVRARNDLPLPNLGQVWEWFDRIGNKKWLQFDKELNQLRKGFGIGDEWGQAFLYLVLLLEPHPFLIRRRGGIVARPPIEGVRSRWRLDISDPSVDVNDPHFAYLVRQFRERLLKDLPPQPQPMKDNPRELDWRPVWEWKKRHPEVPNREIAEMLDRKHQTVRKKLSECEQGK